MKKTTISNFFLPLGLLLYFIISSYTLVFTPAGETQNSSPPPYSHPFYIGAMSNTFDTSYAHSQFFSFNTWHNYTGYGNGWNGIATDQLFADIDDYKEAVNSKISSNYSNGLYTILDRPKIEHIAFAQRSDYQCEDQSSLTDVLGDNYWFYTYENSETGADYTSDPGYGTDVRGKKCSTGVHSPGYVVKDLRAKTEQVNRYWDWHYSIDDGNHQWYVKPKIRIDASFANNPANQTIPVCSLEVLNFEGDVIKRAEIKVRNLKDGPSAVYNGNYIDEFFFSPYLPVDTSTLLIDDGTLFNPNEELPWAAGNKVDFKVYWYGECDMWIDYVRVDNELGHRLLSGTDQEFESWLSWEVEQIANEHPGKIMNFYVEEYELNMLPAIKYVNEKIQDLSNNTLSLITNLNLGLVAMPSIDESSPYKGLSPYEYMAMVPPDIGWDQWKYYAEYTGQETFCPNFYPFENSVTEQLVPNTLPDGNDPSLTLLRDSLPNM
jgi:hypothetical protein